MVGPRRRSMATNLMLAAIVSLSLSVDVHGAIPFYCRLNEIQCPSKIKTCIRSLALCNGIKDCPDGSDENPTLCKAYNCSNRDYLIGEDVPYFMTSKCPSGNMCTKKSVFEFNPEEENYNTFFTCTGGPKECADGSDEDPRYCDTIDCKKGDFGGFATTCPSKKYCLYPKCDRCGDTSQELLCDGTKDCPDGSDEWLSFCKTNGCSQYADETFRCKDKGCVKTEQICNGVKDCLDGSDEDAAFCRSYSCPWTDGNKCTDGRTCLRPANVCDGVKHCADGSDEAPAKCRTHKCMEGMWKCKDGLQCAWEGDRDGRFAQDPRCNNKYECIDKSDESAAVCAPFDCGEFRVKCPGKPGCIWKFNARCDGKVDCLDGSDEAKAFCKSFKCVEGQVKCTKDNLCVTGTLCDGRVDCDDKTDEDPAFCQKYKCPTGSSKCPKFPYQCISNDELCNGVKRYCINGGDEEPAFCRAYTCPGVKCGLKCQDGRFCDSNRDCPDGSDENPTFCKNYKCPKGYAKCADGKECVNFYDLCRFDGRDWKICTDKSEKNLTFCSKYDCGASQGSGYFKCTPTSTKCLTDTQRCDGVLDCPINKMDEDPVFCKNFKCPEEYVKCPDKLQCIPIWKYCDGKPDCKGGVDEKADFCKAYKCPIVRGVQYVKCPDNVRCTDPNVPC